MKFLQLIKRLILVAFTRYFVLNLVLSISVFLLLIISLKLFLGIYTRNGEEIEVPDLQNCSIEESKRLLETYGLTYEVVDSSAYFKYLQPGVVVEQFPIAESIVKRGRKISLTTTSSSVAVVRLPNLAGRTKKDAIEILKNFDLKVGKVHYWYYMAKNEVLFARLPGTKKNIKGTIEVEVGTTIDLFVGAGLSKQTITTPSLKGMTKKEGASFLRRYSLYMGSASYDRTVGSDSASAFIYRQYPNVGHELPKGSIVDIWLTKNPDKL